MSAARQDADLLAHMALDLGPRPEAPMKGNGKRARGHAAAGLLVATLAVRAAGGSTTEEQVVRADQLGRALGISYSTAVWDTLCRVARQDLDERAREEEERRAAPRPHYPGPSPFWAQADGRGVL